MYTSLEIKGFRCFKHLAIPKVARINLIGGKNNTGKTALLEALSIWAAGAAAPDPVIPELYKLRFGSVGGAVMVSLGFADLFTDFAEDVEASIRLGRDPDVLAVLSREAPDETERAGDLAGAQEATFPAAGTPTALLARRLSIRCAGRHGSLTILPDGSLRGSYSHALPVAQALLIGAKSRLDETFLADQLTRLQVARRKDRAVEALRALEPALSRLEVAYEGGQALVHAEVGGARPMPLALLGEGMVRAASLLLPLLRLRGGVLLFDEIENGLHYSVMPDVWRAIAQAATDLDVQVFATTHSHECVEAAAEATADMPGDTFLYHRLDRIDGQIRSATYEPEVLSAAFEMELEVR